MLQAVRTYIQPGLAHASLLAGLYHKKKWSMQKGLKALALVSHSLTAFCVGVEKCVWYTSIKNSMQRITAVSVIVDD